MRANLRWALAGGLAVVCLLATWTFAGNAARRGHALTLPPATCRPRSATPGWHPSLLRGVPAARSRWAA